MSNSRTIAVVSCAYNEEACVAELVRRLRRLASVEPSYSFRFILVDNGSTDSTWERFCEETSGDANFELLKLSRNFGTDGGLSAGMSVVNSDACVLMAADLQDPPEMVSQLLRHWEAGYENIYMVVQSRPDSSRARRILSQVFYYVLDRMTEGLVPRNVSDFRLVDRKVYLAVREMPESSQFLRGNFAWVGFKSIGVPGIRPDRHDGTSKASFKAVSRLARVGIVSFSDLPLRLITWIAIVSSALTLCLFTANVVLKLLLGAPKGFATLISILLLGFSGVSLILAVIAQYVAVLLAEAKSRPRFLISDRVTQHD